MKLLLCGASGMVGRNFLEHPGATEFEVLSPTSSDLNLLDYRSVEDYLQRHRPDMVIHAAARIGGIQANIREPVRNFLENLDMGRNIVWAAHNAKVKRFLNLGSS